MGLDFLDDITETLSFSGDVEGEQKESFRDVINNVRTSCHMAVDILNDLLLYEKLDGKDIC